MEQAEQYQECAAENVFHFATPQIHFIFCSGVTQPMADTLEGIGVLVQGDRVPVDPDIVEKLSLLSDDDDDDDEDYDDDDDDDDDDIPSASDYMKLLGESGNSNSKNNSAVCNKTNLNSQGTAGGCDKLMYPPVMSLGSGGKPVSAENSQIKNTKEPTDEKSISVTSIGSQANQVSQSTPEESFTAVVDCNRSAMDNTTHDATFKMSSIATALNSGAATCSPSVITKVNLDITTLISLVSNVTHGHCDYLFKEKVLTLQAEQERECHLLPQLSDFMKGKEEIR